MQPEIEPGDIRYMVFFEERDSNVPLVRTLKFSHHARGQDGIDLLIFTELFATLEPEKTFVRVMDAECLLDGQGLVQTLQECLSGRSGRAR